MKLLASTLEKVYPGDCGSLLKTTHVIKAEYKKNYISNMIYVNNEPIMLTNSNIDQYVDVVIHMRDPGCCKHTDGFCEMCAGINDNVVLPYYVPGFNVGTESAGVLGAKVSQNVLSAKHLTSTNTIDYILPDVAKVYFVQQKDIYMAKQIEKYANLYKIKIPLNALGALSELKLKKLPTAHTYSTIENIAMIKTIKDDIQDELFNMSVDDKYAPYLSEQMLEYIGRVYKNCVITNRHITIPLSKWDADQPMFKFQSQNSDMVGFAKSCGAFIENKISQYTNYNEALTAYTNLIFQKIPINIYYLKVIMRALMIKDPLSDFTIPVVEDLENVYFGRLGECISGRSISTMLGYEALKAYLSDSQNYNKPRKESTHSAYFGLLRD